MVFNQFDCYGEKAGASMRTNDDKVNRITCLFSGRKDDFGTCDPKSGESYVVKKTVGKTVFVDPISFEPYPNQWEFLDSVHRHKESHLDYIIELNNLAPISAVLPAVEHPTIKKHSGFGLPICAQKMLASGVIHYQRVSCFRLAVHLKRLGLPHDATIAALKVWAQKNRPQVGKQIISESEIIAQTLYAYAKDYRGYGNPP
jgi:hypothetical protein